MIAQGKAFALRYFKFVGGFAAGSAVTAVYAFVLLMPWITGACK